MPMTAIPANYTIPAKAAWTFFFDKVVPRRNLMCSRQEVSHSVTTVTLTRLLPNASDL